MGTHSSTLTAMSTTAMLRLCLVALALFQGFTETTGQLAGNDYQFNCETTCELVEEVSASGKVKKASLDFDFGCGTTCQLVVMNAGQSQAVHMDATHAAFLELGSLASPQADVKVVGMESPKNETKHTACYRLCLNPQTNSQCQRAAQHVALIQMGEMSEAELMEGLMPHLQTQAGEGGDCLATCVRVCTDRIPA